MKVNPYLLVYFSSCNCHVLQVLDITVTGIHATAWGDAMIDKVSANAPVGVALDTTATQLKEEKRTEKNSSYKKQELSYGHHPQDMLITEEQQVQSRV